MSSLQCEIMVYINESTKAMFGSKKSSMKRSKIKIVNGNDFLIFRYLIKKYQGKLNVIKINFNLYIFKLYNLYIQELK